MTLYVNNLNDKINSETLKKSLKEVFAAFGGICFVPDGKWLVQP